MITMAALAFAVVACASTPPAPPDSTVPVTTLPTQPTTTTPVIPVGYTPLVDDTDTITIAVPDAWREVNSTPFIPEEGTEDEGRPSIVASTDIEAFYGGFDVPGVSFFTIPFQLDPLDVVDEYGLVGGCEKLDVAKYDDPPYVGAIQVGTDCGPRHMTWNMVVASPADHRFTAIVQVQTTDPDELDVVLGTFGTA